MILFSNTRAKCLRYKLVFFRLSIGSYEEAALAAIIILNVKKREKERIRLNLGFKGKFPIVSIFSYFVSKVLRKRKLAKTIFAWHRKTLRNYFFSTSTFSESYYTFCFENSRHVLFQFLIG